MKNYLRSTYFENELESLNRIKCFDPYDIWSTNIGLAIKKRFYDNKTDGKITAVIFSIVDWFLPRGLRKILGIKSKYYPITLSQWILCQTSLEDPQGTLEQLLAISTKVPGTDIVSWGIGIPWMSKNGLYLNPPFVTHTPYVMEALLKLSNYDVTRDDSLRYFNDTLRFLESLVVMYEDGSRLALSYAPLVEPRIVVNANAYAAYSYALHYQQNPENTDALEKSMKLFNWVVSKQNGDGSWFYYADNNMGNFIDGFHTCFVIKNLIKTGEIVTVLRKYAFKHAKCALEFMQSSMIDSKTGLVKRFYVRSHKDQFCFDLYDQAEYLGVLLDVKRYKEAEKFIKIIRDQFYHKSNWYCRMDIFGRLWGKKYYRWGIVPLMYQSERLVMANNR